MCKKIFGKQFLLSLGIVLCLFVSLVEGRAGAADYPNRPVEIVVGFGPGTGQDIAARAIAPYLEEQFKQPFVVVNKPGGGGILGPREVAKAKPDGYKIGISSVLYGVVFFFHKDVDFRWKDFAPIATVVKTYSYFSVKPDARWKTFKEFLEEAKANPGKLKYSTYGPTSTVHIFLLDVQRRTGIKLIHVPYLGTGKAIAALLGGHVDMACTFGTAGHLAGGTIRALATLEKERSKDHPDVPTMTELGFPIALSSTYGLIAPQGVPKEIMSKLSQGVQKILKQNEKELAAKLSKLEMRPFIKGPEEFSKQVDEVEEYYKIILPNIKFE